MNCARSAQFFMFLLNPFIKCTFLKRTIFWHVYFNFLSNTYGMVLISVGKVTLEME